MSAVEEKWHALSIEAAAEKLGADTRSGLTTAEAKKRLETYGYNELEEKKPPTFFERLWESITEFIVMILIVSAVISAILGDYVEAAAIIAIVILNTAISIIQDTRAEQALAALKKMAAPEAHVIRDGTRVMVPSRELVPGDLVLLEAGSIVPADLRLVQSMNLKAEEASLTGESVPVNKNAQHTLDAAAGLGDQHNMAFMSTTITYGRGQGVVVATGMKTVIGRIAELIQSVEEEDTPLQRKLDAVGKTLGIASLAICGLVFLVGMLRPVITGETVGWDLRHWIDHSKEFFMLAVSLAIAAVPEGLPAVVTICLALGMQEMVKRHALIRRLPAVETLGAATVICSDKTGTLTQNQMTATRIWVDGRTYEVTGRGYAPEGKFMFDGAEMLNLDEHPVLQANLWGGVLCNDAILEQHTDTKYRMIGDPTEGAMVVSGAKAGLWRDKLEAVFPRVNEIPFDADRKRMTTIHDLEPAGKENLSPLPGGGKNNYVAITKGAPDLVLDCCSAILTAHGPAPLTDAKRQEILEANAAQASQALRVLAVAYRPLAEVPDEPQPKDIEKDLIFVGLQGMIDPARPEVLPAVQKAQGAGLRTIMVTGDYAATAAAIAGEIGILREGHAVVSGAELEAMSDDQLAATIDKVDVFARVAPHHKMRIVSALRKRNNIVAMTGDGVNDAPALKQADIGVAMGITGTDVTKQTADMVLTDDNYVSIVSAIEQGRIIYSNIRKFVYFLLSCNVAEIAILFISTALGWAPPLTAIQLLWLNLLSDGAPALALGLEKGDPDLMDRPPRPPEEPVINREMWLGVAVQTIAITAAVLGAYLLGWKVYGPEHALFRGYVQGTYDFDEFVLLTAETMAFVTLVASELLRAYTSRSERYPLFKLGVFTNKYMQYAVGFSLFLLFLVVYIPVPAVQQIFNTTPITLNEWVPMVPLILLPSVAAEVQKWFFNRQKKG
ncbi:MAG TPA: cation-translocating P-type ATPase [Anaerolineae bacterium]|nr:cation-translocating P-type ATPase [Anaerolineae bacterium]HQI84897.1 cation-translocating P-type ATPase [Anaerolineae bacterium]